MQGPPWCVNQRGGAFLRGFPLPEATRRRMALMAAQGETSSRIARRLKVSEGSVSQILGRFRRTGSLEAAAPRGGRPRSASAVVPALVALLAAPSAPTRPSAAELRRRLQQEGGLGPRGGAALPSVSSIRRLLRSLESGGDGAWVPPSPPPGAAGGGGVPRGPRRNRTAFSSRQRRALEAAFQRGPYPEAPARAKLAQESGLPLAAVTAWFSNRRARWRREAEAALDRKAPPGGGPCCSCLPSAALA